MLNSSPEGYRDNAMSTRPWPIEVPDRFQDSQFPKLTHGTKHEKLYFSALPVASAHRTKCLAYPRLSTSWGLGVETPSGIKFLRIIKLCLGQPNLRLDAFSGPTDTMEMCCLRLLSLENARLTYTAKAGAGINSLH